MRDVTNMTKHMYPFDISRIITQAKNINLILTSEDADTLWSEYSNTMAAGWLCLPESDMELQKIITKQIQKNPKYAPKIITLCGSTKFEKEFMDTQRYLTVQGYIVLSVGLFGHSRDSSYWETLDKQTQDELKMSLDILHKRKIDMADEIMVINKNGYIGESTRSEIEYAKEAGKVITYLETINRN